MTSQWSQYNLALYFCAHLHSCRNSNSTQREDGDRDIESANSTTWRLWLLLLLLFIIITASPRKLPKEKEEPFASFSWKKHH